MKQDVIDLAVFIHGVEVQACQSIFPIAIEVPKPFAAVFRDTNVVITGKVVTVTGESLDENS